MKLSSYPLSRRNWLRRRCICVSLNQPVSVAVLRPFLPVHLSPPCKDTFDTRPMVKIIFSIPGMSEGMRCKKVHGLQRRDSQETENRGFAIWTEPSVRWVLGNSNNMRGLEMIENEPRIARSPKTQLDATERNKLTSGGDSQGLVGRCQGRPTNAQPYHVKKSPPCRKILFNLIKSIWLG